MADKKEADSKKTKRPTPLKRDIQNAKRALSNKSFKSQVRTAIRSLDAAVQSKDKKILSQRLQSIYSLMDKGVKRKIIKSNKANRTKASATAKAAGLE